MPPAGTLPLEEGAGVDFARLRAQRLQRCLAEMEHDGLDALMLGTESNVRYVTGARRIWVGGTRPYAPACVVLADGEIHLMSNDDDGVPATIPGDHLFVASWNPRILASSLAAMVGLARARRIGVDGMTPTMASLIAGALPQAELADAAPAMDRARRRKTPDELAAIRIALAAAESGLSSVARAIRPGGTELSLYGVFAERLGQLGLTRATSQTSFCVATPGPGVGEPPRRCGTGRPVRPGDLVACDAGALYAGYEGSLARTWPCDEDGAPGARELGHRTLAVLKALVDACRPGATGRDLMSAYEGTGEELPGLPIARGLGLGMEPPVVGRRVPADAAAAPLEPGMVLALQVYVPGGPSGGYLQRDVVAVDEEGPTVLTRLAGG